MKFTWHRFSCEVKSPKGLSEFRIHALMAKLESIYPDSRHLQYKAQREFRRIPVPCAWGVLLTYPYALVKGVPVSQSSES